MLAIHWSPVSNTKRIMKNGIIKSNNGVYCFPLTGHRSLDMWWVKAFNQYQFPPPDSDVFMKLAQEKINRNPRLFTEAANDLGFMTYIFEDNQIVLENSIPPNKIIKIVSARNEFGRVLYKQKKEKFNSDKEC